MKEIYVIGMEGYAASSRKEENTLSAAIEKSVKKWSDIYHLHEFYIKIFSSVGFFQNRKLFKFLKSIAPKQDTRLLLVGKSMGGVKTYKFLLKYYKFLKQFERTCTLFVDAHSNDNPFGIPYGKKRKIKIPKKLEGIGIMNIFQHNKFPMGAKVEKAFPEVEVFDPHVNHWNITQCEDFAEVMNKAIHNIVV